MSFDLPSLSRHEAQRSQRVSITVHGRITFDSHHGRFSRFWPNDVRRNQGRMSRIPRGGRSVEASRPALGLNRDQTKDRRGAHAAAG